MTNLRKRLDSVISELGIMHDLLGNSGEHPPCCLIVQKNGEIGCESTGLLPRRDFLKKCRRCRTEIRDFLESMGIEDRLSN